MKKVLSVVLAASVIMANAAAVSAEENETLYQTIDISSMANQAIFAKEGDTDYHVNAYGNGYALNIDDFKNLVNRNGGALNTAKEKQIKWKNQWQEDGVNTLDFGGVPYVMDVEKNKKVALSTAYSDKNSKDYSQTGADITMNGIYTSLKILAAAPNANANNTLRYNGGYPDTEWQKWNNWSKLAVKLDYEDGSSEIKEMLTRQPCWGINSSSADATVFPGTISKTDGSGEISQGSMPDGSEVNHDNWWNGFGKLFTLAKNSSNTYVEQGYVYDYYINEYTVPVNSEKKLTNIHVVGSCANYLGIETDSDGNVIYNESYGNNRTGIYGSMVYAITAVTDTDTLTQRLNAAVAEMEQAKNNGDEITKAMIEKATAIADEITALGKTVPADMAAKIKEYQAEYERELVLNNNKSVTVDLTENGANVALSAKQGDTGYQADLLRGSTGIDVDRFKKLVNRDGGKLRIAKNKELKWNSEWTDGQTTNTLKFGDTDYYFDLSVGGKKTFIRTGEKEYWDKGADIKLEQGYYDNIKILASAGQPVLYKYKDNDSNTWGEMSKLAVKLDYADGTWDIIDNIYTLYGEKNGATWFDDTQKAATGVTTDGWWNGFGNFYTISNASSEWGAGNIENAYGDANGAVMYMNEYTIPVNNKKLLVNMEIVGTRANPAGVTVDKSGNVLYNDSNAVFISDGWGVYNDAVYAVTGVVNGKSMHEALLAETSYDSFNKAFKLYKAQGYTVDDELFARFKALNGYEAYFDDMAVDGVNVSAKLSAFDNTVTGVCIAAVYNDDNSLSECAVLYDVSASTDTPINVELKNSADGKKVKLFFLDGFNTLKPLAISETNK